MFTNNYDGTYTARSLCACGHTTEAKVTGPSLFQYNQGAHAQNAFSYLSADEREALFISGTCATCWDSMFSTLD